MLDANDKKLWVQILEAGKTRILRYGSIKGQTSKTQAPNAYRRQANAH